MARGPRRGISRAMSSSFVVTRREDAVLYVGLNRPEKRNAIHREMLLALVDAVAAAERDRDVRAVIVYGEGPVFSAGVDFGMLAADVEGESRAPFRTVVGEMQAALSRLGSAEHTAEPQAPEKLVGRRLLA